jgi:hypothetical protein
MTSNEPYTAAASQARKLTETAAEAWKEGAKKLTDQVGGIPQMPQVDLNQPVERYFDFVQKTVDLNRDLATRWAEMVNTLTGAARERAESFSKVIKDQADALAGLAAQQAEKGEQVAQEQAQQVEEAEKEQARKARQDERAEAKQQRDKAREPYRDLTKAELSGKLAQRDLPKTGNRDELIDRLVESDNT